MISGPGALAKSVSCYCILASVTLRRSQRETRGSNSYINKWSSDNRPRQRMGYFIARYLPIPSNRPAPPTYCVLLQIFTHKHAPPSWVDNSLLMSAYFFVSQVWYTICQPILQPVCFFYLPTASVCFARNSSQAQVSERTSPETKILRKGLIGSQHWSILRAKILHCVSNRLV